MNFLFRLFVISVLFIYSAKPSFAAEYLNVKEAQAILFPSAEQFREQTIELSKNQKSEINKLSEVRIRWGKQRFWRAEKAGKLLGWFIVDNVIGKHDFITYGAALSPDGKVIGIEILTYRETYGDQVQEESWRNHFKGKTLNDPFKLDKDVPNITGATLSCRNITEGVKRLLALQKLVLPKE